MRPPYVILALPRCRTKWLSVFLTRGDWHCGHEELRHCRSMHDIASWFAQPCTGTVETAAAAFWRLLPPDVRVVTVRRPIPEVMASFRRGGLQFDDEAMKRVLVHADAKLRQLAHRRPGVLQIEYADLEREETCARIFEHCLPYPHDHAWWEAAQAVNIQVRIEHYMRYAAAHASQIATLAKIAKHRMLQALRQPTETEGVSFQTEPWERFEADAGDLWQQYGVAMGEAPDSWAAKNLQLFRDMDAIDALHVYTARSNGRLFGYAVSVIGPGFERPGETIADQVLLFADPSWPLLGMKTARAAIDDLRSRGVARVLMQTGTHGDARRLGTMYRRLGAEVCGEVYGMEI